MGITVYGVDNCEDTQRTLAHLEELGIEFRYVNLDENPEFNPQIESWNKGKRITPTVVVKSGGYERRLAEPENDDLDSELERAGLLPIGLEGEGGRRDIA